MNKQSKLDKAALASRFTKLASLKAELAGKSRLDQSDPRVEAAAFAVLALDSSKTAILHGEQTNIQPWRALHEALLALFPPEPTKLNVVFVDGFTCAVCKKTIHDNEEAEAARAERAAKAGGAEAAQAVKVTEEAVKASDISSAKSPVTADARDAKPATASVNVVALHQNIHSDPHAPLAHRDEPWRSHLQGERSGFRRFDIPKDF